MPVYSHSRLSTYENCPLQFKYTYIDKIKRYTEGIEAFLGTTMHETIKKCYEDIRRTKLDTLDELLVYYDALWQKNWHDDIIITRKDLTREHYHNLGVKMLETYYHRYKPFDTDITISNELPLHFSLDGENKYRFTGFVDRLTRTPDGTYWIHDYKTSAHLPSQEEADKDRQLALYQIGIKKRWNYVKNVRLIWHYLAFDQELVSTRSEESIAHLVTDTTRLIDEIEADKEFLPKESALCDWCEYPDLCPLRKHFYTVDNLPPNKYLTEPGIVLVNRYAELKEKSDENKAEIEKVKEALIEYSHREGVSLIRGNTHKVRVKFDKKLKFPGKSEPERGELEAGIVEAGKWSEVSQLDTTALTRVIDEGLWDKELIETLLKFGKLEETSSIYLSKLKDKEE
jgi:putative RecB family exonuclease